MRKSLVGLGLTFGLYSAAAAQIAEPVFLPHPDTVDYVAHFTVKRGWGPRTDDTRIVNYRDGWARIDLIENGRPSTTFTDHKQTTSVTIVRGPDGEYRSLTMTRGAKPGAESLGFEYDVSRTGERQEVLGESCEVWDVFRRRDRSSGRVALTKTSCVTDDGVELWYKYFSATGLMMSFAQATAVERRPVLAHEVQPPSDLLSLESWIDREKDSAKSQQAYEVILRIPESSMLKEVNRTNRRHYPWTLTETTDNRGQVLLIENESSNVSLRFERRTDIDFRRLTIDKQKSATPPRSVRLDRKDTVLGEQCTWFDMMPYVMDARLVQCRTEDGIILKEQQSWMGSGRGTLEAVQLKRGPVDLSRVLPPQEILSREYWGLPQ
jgi:hypothetical protein